MTGFLHPFPAGTPADAELQAQRDADHAQTIAEWEARGAVLVWCGSADGRAVLVWCEVLRIGSLFSGAAGLDRAVADVFGGEVAWFSEVDPAASKVLAHHFPTVPNLGDITQVDWADVPAVDVLCGGFPCQDVSAAGKRAGIKDGTRSGLWSVFAEAIDALRPRWVVIENVRGLLSAAAHRTVECGDSDVESVATVVGDGSGGPVLRALGAVLGDLADLGYDAQWTTLAAAAVGAPHRRERVFILASATDADSRERPRWTDQREQPSRRAKGSLSADTPRNGWHQGRPESARLIGGSDAAVRCDGAVDLLPTPAAADGQRGQDYARANRNGSGGDDLVTAAVKAHNESQWGKYAPAITRWESVLCRPAPAPTEPNRNGKPRLNPEFSSWMMGWPAGWVTDPAIGISRNDQLRIVGNGVVDRCAAAALRYLLTIEAAA